MTASNSYLETQILTAPPQKLRLFLIEGAIRYAQQTLQEWEKGNDERAFETLVRCRETVTELMTSFDPQGSPLTRQVFDIYMFLFTRLTEAQFSRDPAQVGEVLRVLQIERETWKTICEQHPGRTPMAAPRAAAPADAASFSCEA